MTHNGKEDRGTIGICSFHLCKKQTKVYRCKYCGKTFCREHLNAKPPGPPRFEGTRYQDLLFMEEWRKPGHPCAPFLEHWEVENQRRQEEYREALDRLLKSKPIQRYDEKNGNLSVFVRKPDTKSWLQRIKKKKTYITYVVGVLLLLFVFFLFLHFNTALGSVSFLETASNCSDGTFHKHCSKVKPLYCFNGTLIKNSTFCGCPYDYRKKENDCEPIPRCSDGTPDLSCSPQKPLYCLNGTLIKNATLCSCPYDYRPKGDDCELIPRCSDRTIYGECSQNKPFYCLNGSLVKRASLCGCPINEVAQGDNCISKYETKPKQQTFRYVVRGKSDTITMTVYGGLKDYLSKLPRSYSCTPRCPSDEELQLLFLDEKEQKKYLLQLVEAVRSKTSNPDEQARIAVSLVQNIPYDWEGFRKRTLNNRYPYEVLYDNLGVCGEKSRLLAFILRELGFGVVLFNYNTENHMAVGIKCPVQYSYKSSGFCFIESTSPTIITDAYGTYVGAGELSSTPDILFIHDGRSFDSVSEEYHDAQEWNRLVRLAEYSGYLNRHDYYKWQSLVSKYGIKVGS